MGGWDHVQWDSCGLSEDVVTYLWGCRDNFFYFEKRDPGREVFEWKVVYCTRCHSARSVPWSNGMLEQRCESMPLTSP